MPISQADKAKAKAALAQGTWNLKPEDATHKLYPLKPRPQAPQPDPRPVVEQLEAIGNEWRSKVYPTQFADPNFHDKFVNRVPGPGGEDLPYSAIGWGPDGEAIWSIENPIANAWQRFYYNTFEKPVQVSMNTPEGEPRPWWDTVEKVTQGDDAQQIQPGQQEPTLLTKLVRGPGETLKSIGDLFNDAFEEPLLRGPLALVQYNLENIASRSGMPEHPDYTQRDAELEGRIANMPDWVQNMARWVETSRRKSVGAAADYAITNIFKGLIDGKIDTKDIPELAGQAIDKEAFLSGQLMGTIAFDAATQKEFMRRVKAGESPEIVWREMWNPMAELGTSLLLPGPGDIPLLGKVWQTLTKWARVPKIESASDAIKAVRISPEIEQGLAAIPKITTEPQAARAMESLRDVATAAVRKVIGAVDEAASTPTVRRGAIPILPAVGPNMPTAGHQINATARVVGRTLRAIIQNKNPNHIVEAVNALYKIGGGNPDDVYEAIGYVARNPAGRALLSDDGIRTAVMVRKMIGEDPAAFMKSIKQASDQGTQAVIELVSNRMGGAIENMYPTLTKKIKDWDDAVKAATKAGTPPPPPPAPSWRIAMDRVHQGFQKTLYGPSAGLMNNVFLRLNPAFGVRNYIQGLLHNAVDFGVGSVLRPAKQSQAVIEAYGVPFKGAGIGGGSLGLVGGEKVQGLMDKLGPLNFSRWSEWGEEALAWKVGATSVTDSMEKLLQVGVAIPKVDDLVLAGLNQEAAEALASLVKLNKGNVKQALKAFDQMYKKGEVDLVLSGQWLSFDEIANIRKAMPESADEILQGIADVRKRGGSIDEAAKILEDTRGNHAASTRRLTPVPPEPDDPDFESIGRTLDTVPLFGKDVDGTDILAMNYYGRVNVATKSAFTKMLDDVAVGFQNRNFDSYLRNFYTNASAVTQNTIAKVNGFQAQLRNVIDRMERTDFNIGDEWIKLPWPDGSNRINEIPKTKAEFRNKLWEELWYPVTKQLWQNEREEFIRTVEAFIDTHGKTIRNLPQYERAKKWHALSKLWDGVLVPQMYRRNLQLAIESNDNARAARILANAFGISTADEMGVSYGKRDQLLNIINKNLRPGWPKYKSLDDIPAQESLYALQNKLYKDSGLADAYGPAGLVRSDPSIPGKIKDLTAESIKDIPEPIMKEIQAVAKEMLDDFQAGRNGFRVYNWKKTGLEVTGVGTTNTEWYRNAFHNHNLRDRSRFEPVLEHILSPTDKKHNSREWAYVIETIMQRIYNGYINDAGLPMGPRLQAIMHAGDEAGALEAWNKYAKRLAEELHESADNIENILRMTAGEFYNRFKDVQRQAAAGVEPRIVNADRMEEVISQMVGHPTRAAEEVADTVDERVVAPPPVPRSFDATHTPTPSEAAIETHDDIAAVLNRTEQRLRESWGVATPVYKGAGTADAEKISSAVKAWADEAEGLVSVARNSAARVADKAREFNLLNYGDEYGFDLIAKYLFPYQFWYSRSYINWFKRIAANPKLIGNYKRYRDAVSAENAGMPEWWKYNVTLREAGKFLGMEEDNPLYFNLESLLNPLNGITGVDFNDPERRVDWFTGFMDDANKLGPSLHPLITLSIASALAMQGETEAAARWGGRIIPQTQLLKNAMSLAGVNIPFMQGINDFDPAILAFSQGQDPYERRRVARELGIMQMEGLVDQATALEEAWSPKKTELWRQATERAILRRADSPMAFIANLIGGVGLKARNAEDMQIDLFDMEWRRLWASKDILSPQEFQYALDNLRYKYPWGDTVILARKSGLVRDRAYAYNVLGRIPPGQSTEILELVGIKPEEVSAFYDSKGDFSKMRDLDRQKFITGVVNLGAILDLPDWATKQEWNEVKQKYQDINKEVTRTFGPDIDGLISLYLNNDLTTEEKAAILEKYPQIGDALDYKTQMIMQDEQMIPYYSSIRNAEAYYNSLMWDELHTKYPGIDDTLDAYSDLILTDTKSAQKYKKLHPELEEYSKLKEQWKKQIARWMNDFAAKITDVNPNPRPTSPQSYDQQRVLDYINQPVDTGPYGMSIEELFGDMRPALRNLVLDYIYNDEELSYSAMQSLEYQAKQVGLDATEYLELLKDMMQR